MSIDILVFEPDAAPRERNAFKQWFNQVTDWDLSDDACERPSTASKNLQAWYRDMLPLFPAINGEDAAPIDDENPRLMEYSFAPTAIYIGVKSSEADVAYEEAKRLASRHGLGVFDPQSDYDSVIFPDGGKLTDSRSWLARLLGG